MQIRKLRFRVSGGFAGVVRGTEVEGTALSASERTALARLLANPPARAPGARDLVTYEWHVDTDEGPRHVEVDEMNVPDGLADLVSTLTRQSRPVAL